MENLEMMDIQNIPLVPNLMAAIVPERSAAGYYIGMDFNHFFQRISENFIYQREDIDLSLIRRDVWVVEFFSDEYYPDRQIASWNNTVTLIFDNKNLRVISLKNDYQGKLFDKVGIGDRLDVLLDEYYFLFYFEVHLLVEKSKNREILEKYILDHDLYEIDIENDFDIMSIIYDINDAITVSGVEFNTNYKTQFSKEYADQIIEEIVIFSS